MHPSGAARHGRHRLGTHREHLVVEHPFRHALHVALRGREVGGQWLDQVAGVEYGPAGITVNAVPPGFIDTPMLRNAEARGRIRDVQATIDATPVRRMGKPEDIAAACAFLISDEAGYITGQILGVNGGRNT